MCRATELIEELSVEEKTSLDELARGPARRKVPFSHAEKFISLGLTELICGYQELTSIGKRAVSLMHRGPGAEAGAQS